MLWPAGLRKTVAVLGLVLLSFGLAERSAPDHFAVDAYAVVLAASEGADGPSGVHAPGLCHCVHSHGLVLPGVSDPAPAASVSSCLQSDPPSLAGRSFSDEFHPPRA